MHRSHKVHVRNKDTKSLRLDESNSERIWIGIKSEDRNLKKRERGYIQDTETKENSLNCPLHQ